MIAPMRIAVQRRYDFEAAHTLPWHAGKCSRPHGHSYRLEVRVEGPLDQRGVVMEFDELDSVVESQVIERLDHTDLNATLPNPTAENVALWVAEQLAGLPWSVIELWETAAGSVRIER